MARSDPAELLRYINLKLVALGQPSSQRTADPYFLEIAGPLLRNYHQKDQLLGDRLCPADTRIQQFLDAYLKDVAPGGAARLPSNSFVLDRPGLARVMSLPPGADEFISPVSAFLSHRAGRSAQSEKRPPHHPGHLSHRGRRPARFRRTKWPSQAGFRQAACRSAESASRIGGAAVHRRSGRSRAPFRLAAAAADGLSGHRNRSGTRPWRSASSRQAAWSAIWISWRPFSATAAIPICRKTTPRWM